MLFLFLPLPLSRVVHVSLIFLPFFHVSLFPACTSITFGKFPLCVFILCNFQCRFTLISSFDDNCIYSLYLCLDPSST